MRSQITSTTRRENAQFLFHWFIHTALPFFRNTEDGFPSQQDRDGYKWQSQETEVKKTKQNTTTHKTKQHNSPAQRKTPENHNFFALKTQQRSALPLKVRMPALAFSLPILAQALTQLHSEQNQKGNLSFVQTSPPSWLTALHSCTHVLAKGTQSCFLHYGTTNLKMKYYLTLPVPLCWLPFILVFPFKLLRTRRTNKQKVDSQLDKSSYSI